MLTEKERQAAEQLCERIQENLLAEQDRDGWECRRRIATRFHLSASAIRGLELEESRLIIRRLLAETDDD